MQRPEEEEFEAIDLRSDDEEYMTANEGAPEGNLRSDYVDLAITLMGLEPQPGPSSRPAGSEFYGVSELIFKFQVQK